MSGIASALGAAAPPQTIEHNGRVYTVGLLTLGVRAAVEQWMAANAMAPALAMATLGATQSQIDAAMRAVAAVAGRGDFKFYGPLTSEALQTPAGALKLTSLLLGCSEEEAAEISAAREHEVNAALKLALAASQPKGRGNPNG